MQEIKQSRGHREAMEQEREKRFARFRNHRRRRNRLLGMVLVAMAGLSLQPTIAAWIADLPLPSLLLTGFGLVLLLSSRR